VIGNPAFTLDFPIETLSFHGQATLLEYVHFRNSNFRIRSNYIIFKPVVHVVPESRPLAFRLSSPSDPAQHGKGAFCRQLCKRTLRQLLSLELESLERRKYSLPCPLRVPGKANLMPPILVPQNLRRFCVIHWCDTSLGLTPAGPPCSGPGRVWKPNIENLRFA